MRPSPSPPKRRQPRKSKDPLVDPADRFDPSVAASEDPATEKDLLPELEFPASEVAEAQNVMQVINEVRTGALEPKAASAALMGMRLLHDIIRPKPAKHMPAVGGPVQINIGAPHQVLRGGGAAFSLPETQEVEDEEDWLPAHQRGRA